MERFDGKKLGHDAQRLVASTSLPHRTEVIAKRQPLRHDVYICLCPHRKTCTASYNLGDHRYENDSATFLPKPEGRVEPDTKRANAKLAAQLLRDRKDSVVASVRGSRSVPTHFGS